MEAIMVSAVSNAPKERPAFKSSFDLARRASMTRRSG
jgi:hypothetical protein